MATRGSEELQVRVGNVVRVLPSESFTVARTVAVPDVAKFRELPEPSASCSVIELTGHVWKSTGLLALCVALVGPLASNLCRAQETSPPAPTFQASATVMIRFAQPLNLSGLIGSEGFTVLSVDGVSGVTYLLQVTTNLTTPTTWETIATNVAVTNGLIQFVDPWATDVPARYYRTLMP